jgi:hypothetical protein
MIPVSTTGFIATLSEKAFDTFLVHPSVDYVEEDRIAQPTTLEHEPTP